MVNLRVVSFNVKGMNSPGKRSIILRELKRLKTQIGFLQETHQCKGKTILNGGRDFPFVFHFDSPDTRSRGVAIFVARGVAWQKEEVRMDEEGRWLFVKGLCFGQRITLATLYAPNEGQIQFIKEALRKLTSGWGASNWRRF